MYLKAEAARSFVPAHSSSHKRFPVDGLYRSAGISSAGTSPPGRWYAPDQVPGVYSGLPDARRDDHRSMESVTEGLSLRDVPLRPKELFGLPGGADKKSPRQDPRAASCAIRHTLCCSGRQGSRTSGWR